MEAAISLLFGDKWRQGLRSPRGAQRPEKIHVSPTVSLSLSLSLSLSQADECSRRRCGWREGTKRLSEADEPTVLPIIAATAKAKDEAKAKATAAKSKARR